VGFGGRKLKEEQQPKYLNSPESPVYKKGDILYGLHQAIQAIRQKDHVILVEGYFDLLRLYESGFRNVVASSGTALTDRQARLISRYTRNIYIAYDGDDAGTKASIRVAQILEQNDLNTFIIQMPADQDPDSIIRDQGPEAFNDLLTNRVSLIVHHIDLFLRYNNPPSIEAKEGFIREIFAYLSELKNQLKVGLVLHQISDRLEISESLLIQQYNKQKRKQAHSRSASTAESPIPLTVEVKQGVYKAESALVSLLLGQNQEIKRFIVEHISPDLFEDPNLKELYVLIINVREETGEIDINRLLSDQQENSALYRLISELAFLEQPESIKFTRDCIYQMKKWHLEKKSRELSSFIKAESDSIESVMHYTKELSMVRKEIAELENQLRKLP
jgi:DNA primase